jgi:hypothetical protein
MSATALAPALPLTAESATVIPFPTGRYAVPSEDAAAFAALRPADRERVKLFLACFETMEQGELGLVPASRQCALTFAAVPGFSAPSLRRHYYAWREGGWTALLRGYRGKDREHVPAEFVEHFKAMAEQNCRSMRQAMAAIVRQWMLGEPIPGYGTWREWFATKYPSRPVPESCPEVPRGWGKSNLYALAPTRAERLMMTRGIVAAKAHLPSLVRDTSTLLPLQLITIDDFEVDQRCFYHDPVRRIRAICPMRGVLAMDVATRRVLGVLMKPRFRDDEQEQGDGTQAITRAEVRLLLYGVFRDYGVPRHGMTILCERAAAAVSTEVETTFRNLFGGRVNVSRTSTISQKCLANGFVESGGKPFLKGWIESFFGTAWNVAAALPGQKGASYALKPADFEQKLRVAQRLIGTGERDAQLNDDEVARARLPFLSSDELVEAYLQIFALLENRTEHQMRGFGTVIEWREAEGCAWRPFSDLATLTPEEQERVQVRERRESPRERWESLMPQVQCDAIEPHALMMLLLTPKKAALKGHHLTFVHNNVGYTYLVDPRSPAAALRNGSDVLCYFDPAQPEQAHLCQLDGRHLGEVQRLGKVNIADPKAVSDAEKQLAQLYNAIRAQIRARPLHRETDAKLLEDAQVNAALVQAAAERRQSPGITASLAREVPAHTGATPPLADLTARQMASAAGESLARKATAAALQQAEIDGSSLI